MDTERSNQVMEIDLVPLFFLLEALDGPVRGRSFEEPPEELRKKVDLFLSGTIPDEDRKDFFEAFRGQGGWLAWFAEEIRRRRNLDLTD